MAISIGSAVGAGFTLIGRRPLSVVSWGFFSYFAILLLFVIGVAIVGLPVLAKLASLNGQTPDPNQVGQMMLGVFVALWPALALVMVGGLFIGAMVQGAVIRSILDPDERRFASLRFGRQEVALVLLALLYIPVFILAAAVSVLFMGGAIGIGRAIHGFAGGLFAFIVCVAYAVGFAWVALRFSLAAPMTFAAGGVRFFSSWNLTKGEGWRLYGLAWLLVAVWIGVTFAYSIASSIVNVIFAGAAMASVLGPASANGGAPDTAALMSHWPLLALAYLPSLLMAAAFNGVLQAIAQGPWADVYRQLKGSPDVAATFA
jgi:hypothetical protein